MKVCRRDLREYHFHLFNDLLTYSKRKGSNQYKLHRKLSMSATTFKEVSDADAKKNKVAYAILIGNTHKSFMVGCRSAESRRVWIEKLKMASNLLGRANHKVVKRAHPILLLRHGLRIVRRMYARFVKASLLW